MPMSVDDAESATAFQCLITLFADVRIEGLEVILNDPMDIYEVDDEE